MKRMKKFLVAAFIIVTSLITQNVFASSYPTSGVGVDNSTGSQSSSSSSSSGYVAPASTIDPVILGGTGTFQYPWEITTATSGLGSDVDGYSPYTDTSNNIDYYVCSTGAFKVGDYVTLGGVIYILTTSSYSGYLEAVRADGSGNADTALGTLGEYFLLPVGNGNIILVVLILTYTSYIFYRKKKKEEAL